MFWYISLSDMREFRQIFDFCASLGDAGTRVPARKLHTRPGYINTRIVPGLVYYTRIKDLNLPKIVLPHKENIALLQKQTIQKYFWHITPDYPMYPTVLGLELGLR